jgi:hypothetical protein
MNASENLQPSFCSGFEHLKPWLELADYCHLLARDMYNVGWEDFRKAAQGDDELPLIKKLYGIFTAKRETEEFFEKQIYKFRNDDKTSLAILHVWEQFDMKWEKFKEEWKIDDEVIDNILKFGKQLADKELLIIARP